MAVSETLGRRADVVVAAALVVVPLLLMLAVPGPNFTRKLQKPEATLRCLKGTCFLLPQETLILKKLPARTRIAALQGDKVLALEDSELEIVFPDSSKLIQRNNSLTRIESNRATMLRSTLRKSNSPATKQQAVIRIGSSVIEILYPLADSEIVPETFPLHFSITFRVQSSTDKIDAQTFDHWVLYLSSADKAPISLREFRFSPTQIPHHYTSQLSIEEPGTYLLSPKGLDPKHEDQGFRLRISTPSRNP